MNHKKMHWACCWKPMMSMVLWTAGMVCFVLGLVAITRPTGVFQISTLGWYWNALILGVLAMGSKGCGHGCAKCASCEMPEEEKAM